MIAFNLTVNKSLGPSLSTVPHSFFHNVSKFLLSDCNAQVIGWSLGERVSWPKMSKKHVMSEESSQKMLINYADLGGRCCGSPKKVWCSWVLEGSPTLD